MQQRKKHYRVESDTKRLVIVREAALVASWHLHIQVEENQRTIGARDFVLTSEIVGRSDLDSDLEQLSSHLCSLPQVTVATCLSQTDEPFSGKAFCCLPLPLGSPAALTGLPLHVNASFGLSDNRRDMRWTGLDQKEDKSARYVGIFQRVAFKEK